MSTTELDWEFVGDQEVKTAGELLDWFYSYHFYKRKPSRPITLVNDPQTEQGDFWFPDSDVWIAIYHRKFYVKIEKHHLRMVGVHVAKLYFQANPKDHHWLGTAQFKCNFFNEEQIRKKLRRAIVNKSYFASDKSRETIITIGETKTLAI